MKTTVTIGGLILAVATFILFAPNTSEAINPNEFERAYFISHTNPTWMGSYHRLCNGSHFTEGTLQGGFMVVITDPCAGGEPSVDCFFRLCDDPDDPTTCSGVFSTTTCPAWVNQL